MARPPGARWFWLPGSPDFGGPRLLPNAGQQVGSRATAKLVKACATEFIGFSSSDRWSPVPVRQRPPGKTNARVTMPACAHLHHALFRSGSRRAPIPEQRVLIARRDCASSAGKSHWRCWVLQIFRRFATSPIESPDKYRRVFVIAVWPKIHADKLRGTGRSFLY